MDKALDTLHADWQDTIQEGALFSQRLQPDPYCAAAQHSRMQALLVRRACLTAEERANLATLIDAALDAIVARTRGLLHSPQP